jgi:glycosyltransferase involved in cell wall biosynthesis
MFESMAVERPIVAALWGEAATLIDQAECGIVVEPEDAGAMHQAVEKLAADPALARRLGQSGRKYAIRHFERKDIAERFVELLRLIARRRDNER